MKKQNLFLIAIPLVLLLITILLWSLGLPMMNTQTTLEYEPYKPFGIVVNETTWSGKLQEGKYTKSGILIIKQ